MNYAITDSGGVTEISLSGRLTFSEAPQFPKILAELDKAGKTRWDVRLDQLDFIDSTGMSLFIHIYDAANKEGAKVVIHGCRGAVRDALGRAAFETLFEFQ